MHEDGRTDRQTDMTKLIVDFLNFFESTEEISPIERNVVWQNIATSCKSTKTRVLQQSGVQNNKYFYVLKG